MLITLRSAVQKYLRSRNSAPGTQAESRTTLAKWKSWGGGVPIERLGRKEIREFLDWVYDQAIADEGTNPGRTANKAREHLRAVVSWVWEHDLIDSLPRFPKPRPQRDVAGRHYLTKAENNALYFATHQLRGLRGWSVPIPAGRFWRAALMVFFNYVDSGTIWRWTPTHELILLRHICWARESPDREVKHAVGCITYRHYAHRAPLAFKAITTIPQPAAFSSLLRLLVRNMRAWCKVFQVVDLSHVRGHEGECPCCRRPFADATANRTM